MGVKLKYTLSVFFLAIFLAPAVINETHSFFHEEEFHCQAVGETHIHTQHHDCILCDCVLPVIAAPATFQSFFSLVNFSTYVFPVKAVHYYSYSEYAFASLRAPPAVS